MLAVLPPWFCSLPLPDPFRLSTAGRSASRALSHIPRRRAADPGGGPYPDAGFCLRAAAPAGCSLGPPQRSAPEPTVVISEVTPLAAQITARSSASAFISNIPTPLRVRITRTGPMGRYIRCFSGRFGPPRLSMSRHVARPHPRHAPELPA
ncbi:hypothetical protein DFJ74DRAFT_690177 [Hyaloraphidium curvatum]|nr:hypothetical protein DFJ74DRAFT_690177 [Hyaloraphidium curvatum]